MIIWFVSIIINLFIQFKINKIYDNRFNSHFCKFSIIVYSIEDKGTGIIRQELNL